MPPNPFEKDIYLEIDWQDCDRGGCPDLELGLDDTHHAPNIPALRNVQQVFDTAPVVNVNESSGLNLHILVDERIRHEPNCDQGTSAIKDSYFGPFLQHGGLIGNSDIALPPHTNWKNLKAGRERMYRYVWFGHSSAQNDDVSATLCPKGWVVPLIAQGLGWVDIPEYDYSPFGSANIGGRDILVTLGPLWICPTAIPFLGSRRRWGVGRG